MQPKSPKVRHTLADIDLLIAGSCMHRTASEYVSDFQAKCGVSRQAAIDAVYRMFEAVLPADREEE